MGYALLHCRCGICTHSMSCNPKRVPSIRKDGARQPVCRVCIDLVNEARRENGMDLLVIHAEAYDPLNESELGE